MDIEVGKKMGQEIRKESVGEEEDLISLLVGGTHSYIVTKDLMQRDPTSKLALLFQDVSTLQKKDG
jgi:hypothetical protein